MVKAALTVTARKTTLKLPGGVALIRVSVCEPYCYRNPPRNRGRPRMGRAALRAPTPPGRDRLPALRSGGVPGRRRPGTAAVAALTPPDERSEERRVGEERRRQRAARR